MNAIAAEAEGLHLHFEFKKEKWEYNGGYTRDDLSRRMLDGLEGIAKGAFSKVFDSIDYPAWDGFPCPGSIRNEANAIYKGKPVSFDYSVYLTIPSEREKPLVDNATGHITVDIVSERIDYSELEAVIKEHIEGGMPVNSCG